jgi:hypothetical protein
LVKDIIEVVDMLIRTTESSIKDDIATIQLKPIKLDIGTCGFYKGRLSQCEHDLENYKIIKYMLEKL